ncbi:hypothetical protein QE382_001848 [Sphingobacterium zeae]|uniref:Uncharacterized protein n=1 Tax=Sphingobacterium zeae TaxID=1776859 RepID=A0ABU0U4I1_9SPHI|nr:hypothetical protein [Sphingobacterium zeae]
MYVFTLFFSFLKSLSHDLSHDLRHDLYPGFEGLLSLVIIKDGLQQQYQEINNSRIDFQLQVIIHV